MKTGQVPVSRQPHLLKWIYNALDKHHSRDLAFLRTIKVQIKTMSKAKEQFPWRCRTCWQLAKAKAQYCPTCGGWWETVIDRNYQHQERNQDASWSWQQWKAPSSSNRSTRSSSARRRTKGKGKSKEQPKEQQVSPFAVQAQVPQAPTPFPALPSAYTASTMQETPMAQSGQSNADLIGAVRRAFPEVGSMPMELKEHIERQESQTSRQITQDLHKATASLGRAQKSLRELEESRDRHRQQWMAHLTESLDNWKKQMTSFDEQQEQYGTQIAQAKANADNAHATIQNLNAKAAGKATQELELITPKQEDTIVIPDQEETSLRAKLHGILAECAMKLGDKPKDTDLIPVLSDTEEEASRKHPKRHRSASPGKGQNGGVWQSVPMDTSGVAAAAVQSGTAAIANAPQNGDQ